MKIENENGILNVSLDDIVVPAFKLDDETRESLTAGQELSEEAAENVVTIFEAAVNSKVREIQEATQAQVNESLEGIVAEIQESVQTHVSDYLRDVVIEEWMEENKVVLASNAVAENNAAIVEAMQATLAEHYVEVPEERRDLVEELGASVTSLKEDINSLEEKNIKLLALLNGSKCESAFKDLSEGLAETEVEKFERLVEDLNIDDVDSFVKKATVIRDTFFTKKETVGTSEQTESVALGAPAATKELKEEKKVVGSSVIELAARNLKRSAN